MTAAACDPVGLARVPAVIARRTAHVLAAALVAAALLSPVRGHAQFDYQDGVEDRLATLGIGPEDVLAIDIYPFHDPNDQFGGARAWVRTAQCPEGWIVMTVSRTGTVTHAYTRNGCMIPGLD